MSLDEREQGVQWASGVTGRTTSERTTYMYRRGPLGCAAGLGCAAQPVREFVYDD